MKLLTPKSTIGIFCLFLSSVSIAQSLPWIEVIAPNKDLASIQTINSQADVTVSDGLTYSTHTIYNDAQRAIFRQIYEDLTATQGIEGKYIWSFDGKAEKEAPPFFADYVLGHQFHAQILFFDKFHSAISTPEAATFNGQECQVLIGGNGVSGYKFYYQEGGYPIGMEILLEEGENIVYVYDDWRKVDGIELPFAINIDDGTRRFDYKFQQTTFNSGTIVDFRAPEDLINEEQKLLRHHRNIMDDHLFGTTEAIKSQQADTMTMVNAGEIDMVFANNPDPMIDRIMASRDYTVYDDLVRPQVQISDDGTLAWVIAQIYAKGMRFDEHGQPTIPLEFTCAWIELYKKQDGKWKMTGIVSNFKS